MVTAQPAAVFRLGLGWFELTALRRDGRGLRLRWNA